MIMNGRMISESVLKFIKYKIAITILVVKAIDIHCNNLNIEFFNFY